jgi:YVTN family beta-propeller protein
MPRALPTLLTIAAVAACGCQGTSAPAPAAATSAAPAAVTPQAPASGGTVAYVPSENGATVTVIDAYRLEATKTIALGDGMRPMGTAVSRDGKLLYVTTGRSKMLVVIDTATNAVIASTEVGMRPWGIALSPDGKTAYTANGPSNEVAVIGLGSRRVTATIPVGRGPWGAAFIAR